MSDLLGNCPVLPDPTDAGPALVRSVFGGAHLYYAVRGEDGTVPVTARWRYVGLLAVLLAVGALVAVGGARTLGTVVAVLALATYVLTESVAGYRASRDQSRR